MCDDLINKALASNKHHDACHDCGNRTDGLTTCYFVDGETTQLCPDCMEGSGFCYRCGNYYSGQSSFDFSDMPGYCSDCHDEIKSEMSDEFDNENYYNDPNYD